MDKFGRNYSLEIQETALGSVNPNATLTVNPPFTVEFDITRNTLTSANVCQIRIYNLSEKNRSFIRHNACDYGSYKSVKFKAGYGQNIATIFQGNITQAWSVREGVDFISQLECFDGGFGFVNGNVSLPPFPAGTPIRNIIIAIAETIPNVEIGGVGLFPGVVTRAFVANGSAMQILNDLTGSACFIDNGKFYALGTSEYVLGVPVIISASSGLLGTPILEQSGNGKNTVRFDMLFEPALDVGFQVALTSVTDATFNGNYKITGVKHRGVISEAICGNATTTGEFFFDKRLIGVPPL